MADLDDLVAVSQFAGRDVLLAQGGGGNTSVKSADGTRMWIKASGLRLGQVRPGFGYVEIDVPALVALLDDLAVAALPRAEAHEAAVAGTQAAVVGAVSLRPSLETTFHAVLGRVVLHTHAVYVNAFACRAGGAEALAEAPDEPPLWVPYATPGYALGRAVAGAVRDWTTTHSYPPDTILLANHGLITSAQTAKQVAALTEKVVQHGRATFGALPDHACAEAAPTASLVVWADGLRTALAHRFRLAPQTFAARPAMRRALLEAAKEPEQFLLGGPLVPDDVVYGGHRVWAADAADSPAAWVDDNPAAWPETGRLIVAVRGLGVVLAGPSAAFLDAMEENLLAHVLIRQLIARHGTAQPLPPEEVQYLLAMESEKYRQQVAARME